MRVCFFFSDVPDMVFAAITHNPVTDSHQNPDKWHVRNVVAGPSVGAGADACIVSLSGYAQSGISIKGDKIQINPNRNSLSGNLAPGAGAFHIVVDATACPVTTILSDDSDSESNFGVKFQVYWNSNFFYFFDQKGGDLSNVFYDVMSHDIFRYIKKPAKNLQALAKHLAKNNRFYKIS